MHHLTPLRPYSKIYNGIRRSARTYKLMKLQTVWYSKFHLHHWQPPFWWPYFLLHFPNIVLQTRLHTKNWPPRGRGSVLKECPSLGVCVCVVGKPNLVKHFGPRLFLWTCVAMVLQWSHKRQSLLVCSAKAGYGNIMVPWLLFLLRVQSVILFFTSSGSRQKSMIFSINFLWKSDIQNFTKQGFWAVWQYLLVRWGRSTAVA